MDNISSNCASSTPEETCSNSFMSLLNPPGASLTHTSGCKLCARPADPMADASHCHSNGSSDISPCSPQSSTENRSPSLQEHDYMGLAEISSSSSLAKQELAPPANNLRPTEKIEETDLRLGLAPPAFAPSKSTSAPAKDDRGLDMDGRSEASLKYGLKRGYSDAMSAVVSGSAGCPTLGLFDKGGDFASLVRSSTLSSAGSKNYHQSSATDGGIPIQNPNLQNLQTPPLHCAWLPLKHVGLCIRPGSSAGTYSSLQVHPTSRMSSQELEQTRRGTVASSDENQGGQDNNPQKSQVIGWPPVRSSRKSTLPAHPKLAAAADSADGGADNSSRTHVPQASLYVKVNMDGIPVGRKVDLGSYNSYEDLTNALREMFQLPKTGQGGSRCALNPSGHSKPFHFHNDFSLTYEDKDGDWMLVGDVPWGMFLNAVCRLRIMKSSEGTCTGPMTL